MKKVVLMLSFVLIIANVSYAIAPCVVVSKCGGLKGKYDYVDEVHNAETNTHKLTCQDPGVKDCLWQTAPPEEMGISFEDLEELVSNHMNHNELEGSEPIGNGTVTWTATSPNCYTYTFK